MAKINWDELKKDFILGDYKSLSEFADKKGLNRNGNFNKKTKGWTEEKAKKRKEKSNKIIEKTINKEVEKEVDRNTRHLNLTDKILDKVEKVLEEELTKITFFGKTTNTKIIQHSKLEKLMNILEKAQKTHRLSEGLDNPGARVPTTIQFLVPEPQTVHDAKAIDEWNKKVEAGEIE